MSNTISDSHFGLNFVADYERIGSRPWERYDDIVARLNINQTRFPGGTAAETVFDYRNPNATIFITKAGEVLKLTPLSEYIDYCNQHRINPTIIVPTAVLLDETISDGHRTFDQSQTEALSNFFANVLNSVDPNLKITFEIGNEYETFMTSTEYGRIANTVTQVITETYREHGGHALDESNISEPNIIVQAWGYSVGGGMTFEGLAERNLRVISQFSTENLNAVDGVSSHFYFSEGRNHGTDQAQSFDLIGDQIEQIAQLHGAWETATGRDLISSASEWNVLFRSTSELGLKQIRPIMELFTNFVIHDFDSLDFWSAQYHATSIADASGRLMAAGALFSVLKPAVLGTEFIGANHAVAHSSYTFSSDDRFVDVLVSESAQRTTFDLAAMLGGRILVDGYVIGVDETTADGLYRGLTGLLPYAEPDARVTTTQLSMVTVSGTEASITIDPFETLVLIFAEPDSAREIVYGTDIGDILDSDGRPAMFIGGFGLDVVRYLTATSGVYADLSSQDSFISIERLQGSPHNDTLLGSAVSEHLSGSLGNDYIVGGEGFDTLIGGGGADTLLGGADSDEFSGVDGDDWIMPNGGADTVFGGAGNDTLSVADYFAGVSVWVNNGILESESGRVSFSGVEKFVGTNSNDLFDAGAQNSEFSGNGGNDVFRSLVGGEHVASGGDGDDSFFFFSGSGTLSGGAGNDTFFTDGDRNQLTGGEGDDVFYANGSFDEFFFFGNSGRDSIHGFRTGTDSFIVDDEFRGRVTVQRNDLGSSVLFDDGSSATLFGNFDLSYDTIIFI